MAKIDAAVLPAGCSTQPGHDGVYAQFHADGQLAEVAVHREGRRAAGTWALCVEARQETARAEYTVEMTFPPPPSPSGLIAAAGPRTLEEFVRARLAQIDSQSKSAGPYCSFCAQGLHKVTFLIGGPGVSICGACVQLCREILRENKPRRRWWWPFS